MAGLAVAAAALCMTLPETYNKPTIENLTPEEKYEECRSAKNGEVEASTAIWKKWKETYI